MMYVLHDGTGLSREDCLHWSKPLRKAAADLKRPAFYCSREPRLDDGWTGLLHDLPAIAQDDGTRLLAWLAKQSESHIANWQLMAEAVGYEPVADYTEFEGWAEDPTLKPVKGIER